MCVCARASMCTHVHVHACTQSCPILTPWTVAYQALLSVEFFRQDYWSELPFSSPEDLPNPGIEPMSPALQADSLLLSHQGRGDIILPTKVRIIKAMVFLVWM